MRASDPVHGEWLVSLSRRGRVWCDASSIATGVALEVNGVIVEDAACLCKRSDVHHINVTEFDAAMKGVNLAVKYV